MRIKFIIIKYKILKIVSHKNIFFLILILMLKLNVNYINNNAIITMLLLNII